LPAPDLASAPSAFETSLYVGLQADISAGFELAAWSLS